VFEMSGHLNSVSYIKPEFQLNSLFWIIPVNISQKDIFSASVLKWRTSMLTSLIRTQCYRFFSCLWKLFLTYIFNTAKIKETNKANFW